MIFSYLLNMQSHPSWVCGLKRTVNKRFSFERMSHPSWVCGLKQRISKIGFRLTTSHPSWVCGLKLLRWAHNIINVSHTLRGCVD